MKRNKRIYLLLFLALIGLSVFVVMTDRRRSYHYECEDEGYVVLGTINGAVCISGKKARIVKDQG